MKPTLTLLAALLLAPLATLHAENQPAKKPNILIILADDLGYADWPGHAARDLTVPNLEKLAQAGVSFSQGYVSAPQCSPSRAGLLTGRYQQRFGHENNGCTQATFTAGAKTLAEHLRPAGYATAAFGKWHLGDALPSHRPLSRGFDESFGFGEYQKAFRDGTLAFAGAADSPRAFNAQVFASRAADFVEAHASQPWCIYLALHEPHVDLEPTEASATLTRNSSSDPLRQKCLAVMHDVDTAVGIIMDKLRALGLEQDTLVFYLSDNGAPTDEAVDDGPEPAGGKAGKEDDKAGNGSRNDPLRGRKGLVWEGGIRVPFVVSWPGKIPGGSVHTQPAMTIDILPTIANAIGARMPARRIDGNDIGPWLRRPDSIAPDREFWHYYLINELQAVRVGNWKLVLPHTYRTMDSQVPGKGGTPGKYRNVPTPAALYDLSTDPGERHDLSAARPLVVRRLMEAAMRARRELGDRLVGANGTGNREPGRI